jgi:hypothetical protein
MNDSETDLGKQRTKLNQSSYTSCFFPTLFVGNGAHQPIRPRHRLMCFLEDHIAQFLKASSTCALSIAGVRYSTSKPN